ncbi:hypothetical protein [Denitromonas halophila]|uniref:4Fe-4S ferredoxin-type domain-containing protein n=1 Tax=Denitromonas halophila TaxID=1629404 RepID=A0A557QW12_9RHOO|nr:hypothetical protein [Denitromonas halophila]TVO57079.1 hypothetical protein FHP91_10865 [Denitromonas halophila]
MSPPDFSALDAVGLNLQAVFNLTELPEPLRERVLHATCPQAGFRQLILIGNAGPVLWRALCADGIDDDDPIDAFSVREVNRWFEQQYPGRTQHRLYPGNTPVNLQQLGQHAGWHHDSPFKVGIQAELGTWFAYRVALLADTTLHPTPPVRTRSPCSDCADTPCIRNCPADAMAGGGFALDACIDYRQQPGSRCADTCVARLACPVGDAHRYDAAQIHHGYAHSLRMIKWFAAHRETQID